MNTRKLAIACPTCGSGVLNEPDVWSDYVVIRVGTLDDPSLVAPKRELYVNRRARWLSIATDP